MVILSGSKKSAERKFVSIARFIGQKLFLMIRKDKTKIPKACEETQFIGFAFTGRLTVMKRISHAKILSSCPRKKRFQLIESINEMLDVRAKGWIEMVKGHLLLKSRGWCNYFKGAIPREWGRLIDVWNRGRNR